MNQDLALDRPVLVASHERSGTHFLMNTLAMSFGFAREEHVPLDTATVNMNYHHPPSLAAFFRLNRDYERLWLRKSHHQFGFFAPCIEEILEDVHILYIHRDPRDVAHSYRHFLNALDWPEGPKAEQASAFIRAAPEGRMLRYQMHQLPDILERWREHVTGWCEAAARFEGIKVLRYEDLDQDYDATVEALGAQMEWPRIGAERPEIDQNTIQKSARNDASNHYSAEDLAYFRTRIGETMRRLGYEI
ncbi:MAG: sulfotransferase domain-containing protein [Pseudomonadota bacterium]